MELTVLGKYGPYPKAGGACSSYLVSCGQSKILLDAGNGSFSNLQRHSDYKKLDAVILSHLHSDHISDLLVMRYAIQNSGTSARKLYLPDSPEDMYNIFKNETAYASSVIKDGRLLNIQDVKILFRKMTHSVDSFAVKIAYGGKTLVYSGDTNMNDCLADFAKEADLFLCDAAFSNETLPVVPPHLSSAQAAETARKAEVKKLCLTHIVPEQDETILLQQAKSIFYNSQIAVENETITV
jgi:ribonuclease BN (tRNA processing enzyme)